jgi:DNA-binding MarR family transcriptional regulator
MMVNSSRDDNKFVLRDLPQREVLQEYANKYTEINIENVEASLLLLRTVGDFTNKLNELYREFGLSEGKFTVLMLLNRDEDSYSTPSSLSERAGVTRATMTGLLDGLEKSGLAQRVKHDMDRRSIFIKITTEGKQILDSLLPYHYRLVNILMKDLDVNKISQLLSIIKTIQGNISEANIQSLLQKEEVLGDEKKMHRQDLLLNGAFCQVDMRIFTTFK